MTQEEFGKLSMEDVDPRRAPLPARPRRDARCRRSSSTTRARRSAPTSTWPRTEKHRKALLDFVYAYYAGKAKADTLERSTGLTPDELGKRVVAWCRELVKKG